MRDAGARGMCRPTMRPGKLMTRAGAADVLERAGAICCCCAPQALGREDRVGLGVGLARAAPSMNARELGVARARTRRSRPGARRPADRAARRSRSAR